MAGGQERILRDRIRSVQATKKITRAMELIAASRIVKAQQRVHAAVPYSNQITEVVQHLAAAGASSESPILSGRSEVGNVAFVIIAADRGLCGGYNSGVLRAAEGEIREAAERGRGHRAIAVGRKSEGYLRFRGYNVEAAFAGFSDSPTYEDARVVARHAMKLYADGDVDAVELVYTRFVSAGNQEVVHRPLVPLEASVQVPWIVFPVIVPSTVTLAVSCAIVSCTPCADDDPLATATCPSTLPLRSTAAPLTATLNSPVAEQPGGSVHVATAQNVSTELAVPPRKRANVAGPPGP